MCRVQSKEDGGCQEFNLNGTHCKLYSYYAVQWYSEEFHKWYSLGESHILPEYEFGEMTACGKCWQETGHHGIYSYEYAKTYCNKLNEEPRCVRKSYGVKGSEVFASKFRLKKVKFCEEEALVETSLIYT